MQTGERAAGVHCTSTGDTFKALPVVFRAVMLAVGFLNYILHDQKLLVSPLSAIKSSKFFKDSLTGSLTF